MTEPSVARPRLHALAPDVTALAIVLAGALCAAWSTMDRGFLGDDFGYIARFHALPWSEWPRLFVSDWSGGIWGQSLGELRPFAALTFMIDAQLWGANPLGYHLTNFVLYAGGAWCVAQIVRELTNGRRWVGAAAGVLFAAQPAHAEAVAWITGRVDLLGGVCFLAAFFHAVVFLRNPRRRFAAVASCGAFAVGVFSKEFCLTLPLFVLLWFVIYGGGQRRASWRQFAILLAGYAVFFGVYALCRRLAFGPNGTSAPIAMTASEFIARQIDYLGWFVPAFLDPVRLHRAVLVAHGGAILVSVLALVVLVLAAWPVLARSATHAWRALVFFGAAWYLAATLPMAVATYFSPRHLYLATAGLCVGLAILATRMPLLRRSPALSVLALSFYCSFIYGREVAHWRHAAKVSERVGAAVARFVDESESGENVLLLDAPDVFEGAWTWSWSTPFAVRPPFLARTPLLLIERPTNYFNPPLWQTDRHLEQLANAAGAVLLFVDERGMVQRLSIPAGRLHAAASAHFAKALPWPATSEAWRAFIAELKRR